MKRGGNVMEKFTTELSAEMLRKIRAFAPKYTLEEVGEVAFVGDGIARVTGLQEVMAGEMLLFQNGAVGMAQNFEHKDIGVIVFGDYAHIHEGEIVKRTGKIMEVPVGTGLLAVWLMH